MSKFLHDDNKDDAKAIAILRVFSENSQAKKGHTFYQSQITLNSFWISTTMYVKSQHIQLCLKMSKFLHHNYTHNNRATALFLHKQSR